MRARCGWLLTCGRFLTWSRFLTCGRLLLWGTPPARRAGASVGRSLGGCGRGGVGSLEAQRLARRLQPIEADGPGLKPAIEALADEMMAIIVETARDYAMAGSGESVQIVASSLGDKAAITGAAVLARQETK